MPVIGFLGLTSPGPFAPFMTALHQGLSETGYVEGENVAIEYRWAEDLKEGSERVFDGLSSHAHSVGHTVEPGLHVVEHVLILPALDKPQLGRRALRSERTSEAGAQVAVGVEIFRVISAAMDLGEFCAH